MNEFLIVIPAFNEEENLEHVIQSLKQLDMPFDIVIINDGSKDRTEKKARELGVHTVSHPTNLGYMTALETGFKYAEKNNYPYVILFDGDGQHDPSYLRRIMEAIKLKEIDVVIGSRFLENSSMKIDLAKLIAVKFFRFIIYQITKKRITDPTSGFKAYKAKVYEQFTKQDNFHFDLPDSNFIIDILLQNLTIMEVPVNMYERKHGKSKIHYKGLKPLIYIAQTLLSILIVIIKNKRHVRGGKVA